MIFKWTALASWRQVNFSESFSDDEVCSDAVHYCSLWNHYAQSESWNLRSDVSSSFKTGDCESWWLP